MLSVQEAVAKAIELLSSLIPSARNIRLEEAEVSDEGPWWDITLSFPETENAIQMLSAHGATRVYKLVRVHRDTGDFHAVRNRQL
jgi:hypothetical protein